MSLCAAERCVRRFRSSPPLLPTSCSLQPPATVFTRESRERQQRLHLALSDPLIVRHVLLQAAIGDARRVGRLAKAGRMFWQGSNGSQAQQKDSKGVADKRGTPRDIPLPTVSNCLISGAGRGALPRDRREFRLGTGLTAHRGHVPSTASRGHLTAGRHRTH